MAVDLPHQPPRLAEVEYNRISIASWKEIQEVEVAGSYGDKIGSLVKHLVWLQENDPGTKSIVFSAWADVSIIYHVIFKVLNELKFPNSHLLLSSTL
jgi:hypothetical protein